MAEPLRVSGPSAPRSHSPAGTLPALPASRCSRRRLQRLLTCRAVACATSTPARQRLPSAGGLGLYGPALGLRPLGFGGRPSMMVLKIGVGLSPAPFIIEGRPWSDMLESMCP